MPLNGASPPEPFSPPEPLARPPAPRPGRRATGAANRPPAPPRPRTSPRQRAVRATVLATTVRLWPTVGGGAGGDETRWRIVSGPRWWL